MDSLNKMTFSFSIRDGNGNSVMKRLTKNQTMHQITYTSHHCGMFALFFWSPCTSSYRVSRNTLLNKLEVLLLIQRSYIITIPHFWTFIFWKKYCMWHFLPGTKNNTNLSLDLLQTVGRWDGEQVNVVTSQSSTKETLRTKLGPGIWLMSSILFATFLPFRVTLYVE